jgi:hypothetical protein
MYSHYQKVVLKSLQSPIGIFLLVSSTTSISPHRRACCHFHDHQSAFAPLEAIAVSAEHAFLDLQGSFPSEEVELILER